MGAKKISYKQLKCFIMKNLIFIITIISIVFIASDCKKEEKPTVYMPQEFKDYVDFPVGSYWIYEDSISGAIDSVYIYNIKNEIVNSSHCHFKWEDLIQKLYSNNSVVNTNHILAITDNPLTYKLIGKYFFIYKNDMLINFESSGIKYINYYDSLNINNKYYYNINCFYQYSSSNINCWTKDVGVIRKVIKTLKVTDTSSIDTNIVWKLKRYHINN